MAKRKDPPPQKDLAALLEEVDKSGVSDKVKAAAVKALLQGQQKPQKPPADKFVCVIQEDYPEQMDVLRWLQKDPFYIVIVALHDKDTYDKDDFAEGETSKKRVNGDGTESEFRSGDRKPNHYHCIVKTSSKLRASSLSKRFCNQVHFEVCSDAVEYARYLTHSTFAAREKYQYDAEQAIFPHTSAAGWQWYTDLTNAADTEDICTNVEEWCNLTSQMSTRDACLTLAATRRTKVLGSVMAHGYFYDKILSKGGK